MLKFGCCLLQCGYESVKVEPFTELSLAFPETIKAAAKRAGSSSGRNGTGHKRSFTQFCCVCFDRNAGAHINDGSILRSRDACGQRCLLVSDVRQETGRIIPTRVFSSDSHCAVQEATKTMSVIRPPEHLFVCLKRNEFDWKSQTRTKIMTVCTSGSSFAPFVTVGGCTLAGGPVPVRAASACVNGCSIGLSLELCGQRRVSSD